MKGKTFFQALPNSKLFVRLLASYLCILFLPLFLVTGLLNSRQVETYRKDGLDRIASSMQAVESLAETWKSTAENLALSILLNDKTPTLGRTVDPVENALRGINYMAMLNSYTAANDMIDSVWVYDADHDAVYSSEKTQFTGTGFRYANLNALTEGVDGAAWIEVHNAKLPNFYGVKYKPVQYFTYVYPLRRNVVYFEGYIFVNINVETLHQSLVSASDINELYILNPDGVVQIAGDAAQVGQSFTDSYGLLASGEDNPVGRQRTQFSGRDGMSAVHTVLNVGDAVYVGTIHSPQAVESIRITYIYGYLLLAISLLIGVPLCYFISRRMYNPISVLIQDFEASGVAQTSQQRTLVQQTLNSLSRKQRIRQETAVEGWEEPEAVFNRLLQERQDESVDHHLSSLEYYAIVLAEIDEPGMNTVESGKLIPYFEQLLRAFARRLARGDNKAYTIAIRNGVVALVLSFSEPSEYGAVTETLESLRSMFASFNQSTISFAVSRLTSNVSDFRPALSEAEAALRWKMLRGLSSIIYYEESFDVANAFVYPKVQVSRVFAALDMQTEDILREEYAVLVEELKASRADAEDLTLVFHQIIGQMLQYTLRHQIPKHKVFTEYESALYRYVNQFDTLDHIAEWVLGKLVMIQKQRIDTQPGGNLYINRFQTYMADHYMQKISPEEVATALGISYSYLRRLLNVEMNISFSAYLSELRIHYAKDLLIHTKLSQREIAQQVGFGSEQTFHRAFKAIDGISPGEYRRQNGDGHLPEAGKRQSGT